MSSVSNLGPYILGDALALAPRSTPALNATLESATHECEQQSWMSSRAGCGCRGRAVLGTPQSRKACSTYVQAGRIVVKNLPCQWYRGPHCYHPFIHHPGSKIQVIIYLYYTIILVYGGHRKICDSSCEAIAASSLLRGRCVASNFGPPDFVCRTSGIPNCQLIRSKFFPRFPKIHQHNMSKAPESIIPPSQGISEANLFFLCLSFFLIINNSNSNSHLLFFTVTAFYIRPLTFFFFFFSYRLRGMIDAHLSSSSRRQCCGRVSGNTSEACSYVLVVPQCLYRKSEPSQSFEPGFA